MLFPLSFGSSSIVWVVLPLGTLLLFTLIFIAALLRPGTQPAAIGKAIYNHVLQALGVGLMSISGIPACYAVIEQLVMGQERFTTEIYVALLVLFATGGLLFLWHEESSEAVSPSQAVVSAIFLSMYRLIGMCLVVIFGLSMVLTVLFDGNRAVPSWWIMPGLLFLFGVLLSWCVPWPRQTTATEVKPVSPEKPKDRPSRSPRSKRLLA